MTIGELAARLKGLFLRQDEAQAETENHLLLLTERYVRQGMTPEEARAAARRQFGNLTQHAEARAEMQTLPSIDSVWRDLRFAVRQLRRTPTFTATAMLTLALGTGATSAIFSVLNPLLLKPLPYPAFEQLMTIAIRNQVGGDPLSAVVPPYLSDLRVSQTFEQIVGHSTAWDLTLTGGSAPAIIQAVYVSSGVFEAFGIRPVLGSQFKEVEQRAGAEPVAVVTEGFWQRHFGFGTLLAGQRLTLNGQSFRIVGVIPASAKLPGVQSDVWLPFAQNPYFTSRFAPVMNLVGRLKPGATPAQAQAEINAIAKNVASAYPSAAQGRTLVVLPLRDHLTSDYKTTLFLLAGAVGFLLLIACTNVANLLLARGVGRASEIGLRAALGASRSRLVQQLLIESVFLAFAGGALGLLIANFGSQSLFALAPKGILRPEEVRMDPSIFGFAMLLSLATGLLFGIAPAIRTSRNTRGDLFMAGRGSVGDSGGRLRGFLVVSEVAFTVVLLVGAGLLVKSFNRLSRVDPGFRAEKLVAMSIELPGVRYETRPSRIVFYEQLLQRLRALPRVEAVVAVNRLPLGGSNVTIPISVEGSAHPTKPASVDRRVATPDYFSTIGIPVRKGRGFADSDREETPLVAVVNETMARQFWPDGDALGSRVRLEIGRNGQSLLVVGVVGDVRHHGLDLETKPEIYVPYAQTAVSGMTVLMRAAKHADFLKAVSEQVWALDPLIPVPSIRSVDDVVATSVARPRFRAVLIGLFAILAVLLSSVGIYGVLGYSVTSRTKEIGLRMALGAERTDVMQTILQRAAFLVLTGITVGSISAYFLARFIKGMLYEVAPSDPLTFVSVAGCLAGVALLASYVPVRRAMHVEPSVALRGE